MSLRSMRKTNNKLKGPGCNLGFLTFFLVLGVLFDLSAQAGTDTLLLELMQQRAGDFEKVLSDPKAHRVQILYTQIDRKEDNAPVFRSYSYRLDPNEYFYPASSIKLFGAALALEKIDRLRIEGLNRETWMRIDSSFSGQQAALVDTTSASGRPSMGHYVKKLFVLSDNEAYNRTYEFLGQDSLNLLLKSKGYEELRLTHRLSVPLSEEENRHTNAMEFYTGDTGQVIYRQEARRSTGSFRSPEPILLGKGHQQGENILEEPMDFAGKNFCTISELQKGLRALVFPESLAEQERFDLTDEDREFLLTCMSQLPRETLHPDYGDKPDNYCKFFMYGDDDQAVIPSHIRIFNKIGLAYGFCIDNAYIVDFENGIEFLLTAVIYANDNEILNDGNYEYETLAFPFLAKLGRMIYEYERERPRPGTPNLDAFKLNYDKTTEQ